MIDTGDVFFDLQISVIGTLGDEWNPGGITSASGQFIYVDGVGTAPFPAGKTPPAVADKNDAIGTENHLVAGVAGASRLWNTGYRPEAPPRIKLKKRI